MVADLANLDALDGKVVFGSMNRGGFAGASFELDDRMTGYDVQGILDEDLTGGKMLLRFDLSDPGTATTAQARAGGGNAPPGYPADGASPARGGVQRLLLARWC